MASMDSPELLKQTDGEDLRELGYEAELSRKFSFFSMLCLAYCVLGTWSTFAQGLGSGLSSGGPVGIIYGLLVVFSCNMCIAMSLGELCSAYPTALGQGFYVSQLWPGEAGRFLSYVTVLINAAGWWTLSASQAAFMGDFMLSMKVMYDPEWKGIDKGWLHFLVYAGLAIAGTLFNAAACRKMYVLPRFNNGVFYQNVILLVAFSMTLLICVGVKDDLQFQSGKFVFGKFVNETGWNDGVCWFIGLIQAAYGLTAFDSVIHLVEEMPRPSINAPRVLNLAILTGTLTGYFFLFVMLYCIQDLDGVINTATELPFMQLSLDAIGLTGSAVLLAIYISNGTLQLFSIMTTSSRLTWSFARDGGLLFHDYFAKVDPTWQMPVRATMLQGGIVVVIGLLYLFSNATLEAILSVSTIALTVSYAIPIGVLLFVGRDKLEHTGGSYKLGRFGYTANVVSVIYCAITTVFFFFPSAPGPAPADMNYAIVVFGAVLLLGLATWFLVGRKRYLLTAAAIAERARAERALFIQGLEASNKLGSRGEKGVEIEAWEAQSRGAAFAEAVGEGKEKLV
ncbi:amino acid/polyamine transporter I [Protomyces lactucae-debilis]|uniref:Amino acid/polyamine transporter I n=1 Tax=Protomyces lactucae-debilis TaxID=2754530 RepID=A0A1Y2FAN8_PROLT|nr:amino acid/polyamine transporter I [Protomyces lactucae-debilis]ORY80969.1 amino acid/polyamine transporter I [Protomyces lactucae-debilis]